MQTTALISGHHLLEAFDEMSIRINGLNNWELSEEFNQLSRTYSMMLEYIRQGQDDPMNNKLYTQLIQQAYELNDRIQRLERLEKQRYELYKVKLQHLSPSTTLSNMFIALESYAEQKERGFVTDHQQMEAADQHDANLCNLFTLVWTSGAWNKPDAIQATELINSTKIAIEDKALFISSVTLSLIEYFDERKIMLLFEASQDDNMLVAQRSLVGLLLALIRHNGRLADYNDIEARFSLLCEKPDFVNRSYDILCQLQNTLDTEKVNERMRNEIIPNIIKSHNFRRTPMGFEEIDDMLMGKDEKLNWEEKRQRDENEERLKKQLNEMAQLQMDGADVYLNTFAHLKNTPFFSEIAHWFTPFKTDHPIVMRSKLTTNKQLPKILSLFLKSAVLCDSDKYSFCFILDTLPDNSQEMLAKQMGMNFDPNEMDQLTETVKAPKAKPNDLSRTYIHDLFRFFNIYTGYSCTWNPFKNISSFSPMHFNVLQELLPHSTRLQAMGDMMMKKEYYEEARNIYLHLDPKECEDHFDIITRLAFCCHKLMDKRASEYYEMANRLRPDSVWTLTHYAQLAFALGAFDKAATCYGNLLRIDSENVKYITRKARCHICMEEYDEALTLLYKAAYLDESTPNTIRSIAWCLIMQGNYTKALEYQGRIDEQQRHYNDLMNLGHCLYAQGKIQEAFEAYRRSHELSQRKGNGHKDFIADFKRDFAALGLQDKGHGISMPQMIDAICDIPSIS